MRWSQYLLTISIQLTEIVGATLVTKERCQICLGNSNKPAEPMDLQTAVINPTPNRHDRDTDELRDIADRQQSGIGYLLEWMVRSIHVALPYRLLEKRGRIWELDF